MSAVVGQELRVRIFSDLNAKSTEGTVRIQFWNKKERTLRAIKFGGMSLGLAIASIFIPLLHFFLVPTLLLATPIVAFHVLGQESAVLGGEGICPHCQAFLPIVKSAYRFPIKDLCAACKEPLLIEPV